MKKTKKPIRTPLELSPETVRPLARAELAIVVGGADAPPAPFRSMGCGF